MVGSRSSLATHKPAHLSPSRIPRPRTDRWMITSLSRHASKQSEYHHLRHDSPSCPPGSNVQSAANCSRIDQRDFPFPSNQWIQLLLSALFLFWGLSRFATNWDKISSTLRSMYASQQVASFMRKTGLLRQFKNLSLNLQRFGSVLGCPSSERGARVRYSGHKSM